MASKIHGSEEVLRCTGMEDQGRTIFPEAHKATVWHNYPYFHGNYDQWAFCDFRFRFASIAIAILGRESTTFRTTMRANHYAWRLCNLKIKA